MPRWKPVRKFSKKRATFPSLPKVAPNVGAGSPFCADAIRLLTHPRNKDCTVGGGFRVNGAPLSGITNWLRSRYYPHFIAKRLKEPGRAPGRHKGKVSGSVADSQVTNFISTGCLGVGEMSLNDNARIIMKTIREKLCLRVVSAQQVVYDLPWQLATPIDVVCQTIGVWPMLVIIENKTTLQTLANHLHTYKLADACMPALMNGFETLANSEYNHHMLQLAAEMLMITRNYDIQRVTGYIIMACSDLQTKTYPMTPEFLKMAERVFSGGRVHSQHEFSSLPLVYARHAQSIVRTLHPVPPCLDDWHPVHLAWLKRKFPGVLQRSVLKLGVTEKRDTVLNLPTVWIQMEDKVMVVVLKIHDPSAESLARRYNRPTKTRMPTGAPETMMRSCFLEAGMRIGLLKQSHTLVAGVVIVATPVTVEFHKMVPASFIPIIL